MSVHLISCASKEEFNQELQKYLDQYYSVMPRTFHVTYTGDGLVYSVLVSKD